ncbi:hypothetical protein [Thermogutta terrifontis]|uniref:hypothetical protein n=1 Tax=Thermogutta terrifontis TaxID=1331910 RepID=UPI000BA85779|nr:hypothetical protein [Thermogutta terrifontis]
MRGVLAGRFVNRPYRELTGCSRLACWLCLGGGLPDGQTTEYARDSSTAISTPRDRLWKLLTNRREVNRFPAPAIPRSVVPLMLCKEVKNFWEDSAPRLGRSGMSNSTGQDSQASRSQMGMEDGARGLPGQIDVPIGASDQEPAAATNVKAKELENFHGD